MKFNIIKKLYQNAKANQENLQKTRGTFSWWLTIILASAFVTIRVSAMMTDDLTYFLPVFIVVTIIIILLVKISDVLRSKK